VPCNTTVRGPERRRPPRKRAGAGRKREVPFIRADTWTSGRPESRWERITVRDGEKGPLVADAMTVRARAGQEGRAGPEECLVVIRPLGESRIDYALTNAGPEVPLAEVVRARRRRHRIEEMFAAGDGEAGSDHYEVRSWVGWRHHMALSLVALWLLCLERRHVGGENPGDHGAANPTDPGPTAPRAAAKSGRSRPRGDAGAAA
jgi:SRSO17 transposase